MRNRRSVAFAAILACTTLLGLAACGGGDKGPTGSSVIPDSPTAGDTSTPVASAPVPPTSAKGTGLCEGKETFKSSDGAFEFCVLESTLKLEDDRCMFIPEDGGSWTHTIGIQKGSGYFLDQIFTSADNNCGATGEGGVKGPNNDTKFNEGDTVVLKFLFGSGCGRKQQDIYAVVNGVRTWVRAVVANYPKACRTCESAKLELSKQENNSGSGFSVAISADWSRVKGDSAAIEGPGASGTLTNPGAFPVISLPKDGQTRTYTVTLTLADGTKCVKTISVTPPAPGCSVREVSLSWSDQVQESSVHALVVAAGQSGTLRLTWSGTASSSTIDPDTAVDPPAPANTGTTSPATLGHTYAFGPAAKSYTAKGVVTFKDGTKCEASTTVEVRAYSCRDFPPAVQPTVTLGNPDVTLTPTHLTINSIPVTQDAGVSGSFSPTLPSGPHLRPVYPAPASSQKFDYNWTKSYSPAEGLSCPQSGKVTKEVPIPPTEPTCEQSNPNYGSVDGSGSKTVTVSSPATPTLYFYDGDSSFQNDCVDDGGTFFANLDNRSNVCRTPNNHGEEWDYNQSNDDDNSDDEADRYKTQQGSAAKYSLTVASSWSVAAGKAQTLTFEIVYNINSDNFVKKSKSQSFECGKGGQGSLTWGPGDQYNNSPNYGANDGHITGSYTLRVKRGATVVGTFPLP